MWMVRKYVAGHIPSLVHQAKRSSNAELYAEVMIDNCPPKFYEQALEYLKLPTLLDELVKLNAEVATVRPWFEELQLHLVAQLEEVLSPVPGASDAAQRPVAEG